MNEFQHFTEHTLQEIALIFMAVVYTLRIRWLLKFKAGKERQLKTGDPNTSRAKGVIYSWANIMMPWAMESTRTKLFIYFQFALFHIGVTVAIALSFVIPYAPTVLKIPYMISIIQILTGLAFVIGIFRIIRRLGDKYMRAISTPDDYFSLLLLTVWFFFTTLSVPNNGGWIQATYFILTAFFLIYVPFSKISHYLYYPFTRYYFGKTMGYRGTYPIKHVTKT
jgi:nitrate reductase gamma subunit